MSERIPSHAKHLGAPAKRWYLAIKRDWDLNVVEELLLVEAATSWERAQQCREIIAGEGLIVRDRHGHPRAHPAAAILRDSTLVFGRLVRQLGFKDTGDENESGFPVLLTDEGNKVYSSNAERQRAYRLRSTGQSGRRRASGA